MIKACDGNGGGWTLVMGAPWKPSVPKSEVVWHAGILYLCFLLSISKSILAFICRAFQEHSESDSDSQSLVLD